MPILWGAPPRPFPGTRCSAPKQRCLPSCHPLSPHQKVLNVGKAKVSGLKGLTYLDKSKDPKNPSSQK
jgi:hypothetical protein